MESTLIKEKKKKKKQFLGIEFPLKSVSESPADRLGLLHQGLEGKPW